MIEDVLDDILEKSYMSIEGGEQEVRPPLPRRERFLLLALALAAGLVFDYLFYRKIPGISYPVYTAMLLGLFWWVNRRQLTPQKSFGWFLLIPVFLLSASYGLSTNPVLSSLNLILIPVLMGTHTILVTDRRKPWARLGLVLDIFRQVVPLSIINIPKPFLFLTQEVKSDDNNDIQAAAKKIGLGLFISVPILIVVIPLLSSADMVFRHYLTNLTDLNRFFDVKSAAAQVMIVLFVSVYIAGYLWSFQEEPRFQGQVGIIAPARWDPVVLLTVLSVVNLVYLLFTVIQSSYLYGGLQRSLPAGFTYAEYARRGFWELVAVTVINLTIVLCSIKFTHKENRGLYRTVKILLSLLTVFSLNMLISAHFKMSLYEQAYGLTYLRVFVHYFMALLFVLYILALVNIWLSRPPLVKSYIVIALIFYTVLNFINVDKIIARYNFAMFANTGHLDFTYLQGLSDDAIPEIVRLVGTKHGLGPEVNIYLNNKSRELSRPIPWQSMNLSRYRAKAALADFSGK